MTEEMWERIKELADLVKLGYMNTSMFNSKKKIAEPKIARNGEEASFLQLGLRPQIPKWVFTGTADNRPVASECTRSLVLSEKEFLIKKMENSQEKSEYRSIKSIEYKEFLKEMSELKFIPTDIFLPISTFLDVYKFYKEGLVHVEGQLYLKFKKHKIRVHWSNKFLPFNKIYILDSSGIKCIQKQSRHMINEQYSDHRELTDKNDILQIRAKILSSDKVDFLMRIILSVSVDSNKVRILEVPREQEAPAEAGGDD